MTVAVVATLVLLLVGAVVVVYARDPGPTPEDIAVGYELAWDRLDFDALWSLSGPSLRDGLDKTAFMAAKREAYRERPELQHLAGEVHVEGLDVVGDRAVVRTRLTLRDGSVVRNEVGLDRHTFGWTVADYHLVGPAASDA